MIRWFISYQYTQRDMLGEIKTGYHNTITDVSPARWVLESQYTLGGERVVLYAEMVSNGLAIELSHGGAGVPTTYFDDCHQWQSERR